MFSWKDFVIAVVNQNVPVVYKRVQLAQSFLECGRGTSELFLEHGNPYGMKFRNEMLSLAKSIEYRGDVYCKFETVDGAVKGYWVLINRQIYRKTV